MAELNHASAGLAELLYKQNNQAGPAGRPSSQSGDSDVIDAEYEETGTG